MTPPATSATTAATTGSLTSGAQLGADMTMFLKLLTTQMQNQDPLNPTDSAEYTQQLVQFSQVEQAIQQNHSLTAMLARMDTQDLVAASSLVGSEASFASNVAGLTADAPARWSYVTDGAATSLTAIVTDAKGKTVAKSPLTDPAGVFAWAGNLPDGGTGAEGSYTLTVDALNAAGSSVPVTIRAIGKVGEATQAGGALQLVVNGARYPLSSLAGMSRSN